MGWQISRKGDLYRIWSTVSDTFLTDWMSRRDVLAYYYDHAFYKFKKEIIEQYLSFPHHWGDYDGHRPRVIVDEERNEQYCQWLHEISEKRDEEEYCRFIDEMFEKVKKEIGVGDEETIQGEIEGDRE